MSMHHAVAHTQPQHLPGGVSMSLVTASDCQNPDYTLTVKVQLLESRELLEAVRECFGACISDLVVWCSHTFKGRMV